MAFPSYQYFSRLYDKISAYRTKYHDEGRKVASKLVYWNLKFLLSTFGKRANAHIKSGFTDNLQHISIRIAGGLGDHIINAKYISSLAEYIGKDTVFYILAETEDIDFLKTIYKDKSYIKQIISNDCETEYDLALYVVRFPKVLSYHKERLSMRTLKYVEQLKKFEIEHYLLLENDFLGRCYSLLKGRKRENQADIGNILQMARQQFLLKAPENSYDTLQKFGLQKNCFITLQTGSGRHFRKISSDVRQWPAEYYAQLAIMLKRKYPRYKIVQLGDGEQQKIANIDIDLRGKTDYSELLILLKEAKLHIAQESGMIFLRHFLQGGVSVVLFGPTDINFFGYTENLNLSASLCDQPCEWIVKNWMEKCVKTGNEAECMRLLVPEKVFNKIYERNLLL